VLTIGDGRSKPERRIETPTKTQVEALKALGAEVDDGGVRIDDSDRGGQEKLLRYCARPPFAQDHLGWWNEERQPIYERKSELTLDSLPGRVSRRNCKKGALK
jgi:hypothetical protein